MSVTILLPTNICSADGKTNGQPTIPQQVFVESTDISNVLTTGVIQNDGSIPTQVVQIKADHVTSVLARLSSSFPGISCPTLPVSFTELGQKPIYSNAAATNTLGGASGSNTQSNTATSGGASPQGSTTGTPQPKPGTNTGAIVGSIFAGLIVGILIGAAILFLLGFRRQKPSKISPGHAESAYGYSEGKHGISSSTNMSIPMDSAAGLVERNLPDPIADDKIHSEFSKIDDKINGHVKSYYTQSHATDHLDTAQAIFPLLGAGGSVSLQKINALLANPQTRLTVLRFAMAKIITSRMDIDEAGPNALLPFGTAATIHSIPKVQTNDPTRMAFMTKWRAITAYLMGIPSNTNTVSEESIRQTALECDQIVRPYATPTMDQQARLQNLEEICRRAGRVAGMLFSQQAHNKFDWAQSGSGLVVFPGLVKITNETGGVLPKPMVFADKKIVQA